MSETICYPQCTFIHLGWGWGVKAPELCGPQLSRDSWLSVKISVAGLDWQAAPSSLIDSLF